MFRTLLLSMGLLASGAGFAATSSPFHPELLVHCTNLDYYSCTQQYFTYCHWDPVDHRCEPNIPSSCGTITDPTVCHGTAGCDWDDSEQRCEDI